MGAPSDLAAICAANLRSLLAMEEPRQNKWCELLTDRLDISRQTSWRLINQGTDSLTTIGKLASMLDVKPARLIDDYLFGTVNIRARFRVGGQHGSTDFQVVAWIEETSAIPTNPERLVARQVDGQWVIMRYADGDRIPGHRVLWHEGAGEPLSRPVCFVPIYAESGQDAADELGLGLGHHGFSVIPVSDRRELVQLCCTRNPDIVVILAREATQIADEINTVAQRIVPAVMISIGRRQHVPQPELSRLVSSGDPISVLAAVRSIVHFSRSQSTQRLQPNLGGKP